MLKHRLCTNYLMIQSQHVPALLAQLEHCTLISNTSQHLYVRLMLPYEEDDIFPMTKKNLNMYIHSLKFNIMNT